MRVREQGFTLIEMLAVLVIVGIVASALSISMRGPSPGARIKSTAQQISSRLRGLRAQALANAADRVAVFDLNRNIVTFPDGLAPVAIDRSIAVVLTSADSERIAPRKAGIRFFSNGGSSGGALRLSSGRLRYVIRVNWLTGRISIDAA